MSKVVDQRVVEMQFDNKQFEKNVASTMSTLDKLKQKLNLSGSAKGFQEVGRAAKNVNMSGLASGVDTVTAKFSALQVMGVTALANLTNSAVNAGKRMVSALTVDPIKTGFQEYETQLNAVQTILANTQSKGSTLDDVNKALDQLNVYADKTIYNFTEMTRNIGTFTAAGVDLETSVSSIKGIANLAAVSGSTSQQASTAMYQLSQALAAGKVSLMDWNSVVNAGMGGELFQNALIRTSELLKTGAKDAINTYGSFRESLTKGEWLTTEVLTETLKQLSGAYTEADLIGQGFTETQAKEIIKLAETASDAATKVKTFTQLWDVMKESAQSGWAQTWKTIVGDFEEAKNLLTPLADFLTGDNGLITKMSNARNELLESALGKTFASTFDGVSKVLNATKKGVDGILEPATKVTKALEDLGVIVDDTIFGKFGNGKERFDALTEAGYNWYRVQNQVNEKLGNSKRYTEEQIAAQDKLLGTQTKVTEKTEEQANATFKITEAEKRRLKTLVKKTDAQLKEKGYTEEQIKALRELEVQADKLGLSYREFIDNMDQINGRWLIWNSFKNIGQSLVDVFTSIGKAYRDIFPAMTGDQLFDIIAGFHKLTSYLRVNEETANKIQRTFRGLFAAIDIVTTILSGGLKIAFKVLTQLLKAFDMDILDVTANLGDAIVNFRDWIDRVTDFTGIFEKIAPVVKNVAEAIKDGFNSIRNSDIVHDMIRGLVNGLREGATEIWNAAAEIGKKILEAVKNVLGIHSPSKEFFEIGKNIVEGLVDGIHFALSSLRDIASIIGKTVTNVVSGVDLKNYGDIFKTVFGGIADFASKVGSKLGEFFGNLDFGTLIATGLSSGSLFMLIKIGKALDALASPLEGIGDILENAAEVVDTFKGVLKSFSMSIKAKALKDIAIALAILVGSIALLTFLPADKVDAAVDVIVILALALAGLSFVMGKVGSVTEGLGGVVSGLANIAKISGLILAISFSVLMLAGAVKMLANAEWKDLGKAGAMAVGLGLLVSALLFVNHKFPRKEVDKVGKMIFKIAAAMLLIAIVAKIAGGMNEEEMDKAAAVVIGFSAIVAALVLVSRTAGKQVGKIGSTILKISVAMLILVGVAKLLNTMTWGDMGKAAIGLLGFTGIIALLVSTTKLATDKELKGLGKVLMGIGAAMFLLAMVAKIVADMSWGDMGKAGVGLVALAGIITGLIAATNLASDRELKRVGSTILMVSISIGILAGVAMILSLMNTQGLVKGIAAVGVLGTLVAMIIYATRGANDCKANLVVMTIAIAALTTAVIMLSMIEPGKLAGATAALSILMGMFALIVKSGGNIQTSLGKLIVMTAIVAIMAAIVYKLATLVGDSESAIKASVALSMLMLSMAATMKLLATSGPFAELGVKAAALMGLVVAELAIVLGILTSQCGNIDSILPVAGALSILLLALSAACLILAPLGATGPAALVGAGILAGVIAILGAVAIAIGELMTYIPTEKIDQWKEGINKLMDLLSTLSYGLGKVVGSFVGGILDGALSGLPAIGTHLSNFMTNAQGFIDGAKTVDDTVLKGAGILAATITALTVVDLIEGIATFGGLAGSFADLGTELSSFMLNAMPFITGAKLIDMSVADGMKALAQTILILTAADVLSGLTSWFGGDVSLAEFGEELVKFGPSMVAYANTVSGIDAASITASAEAAKAMVEVAAAIPNSGGLAGLLAGNNDIDAFGEQMVSFGLALRRYGNAVDGLKVEAIAASINAVTSMSDIASALPNTGGLVSWLTGDNDMVTFGNQLVHFGSSMRRYGTVVDGIKTEAIANSVAAAKSLSDLAKALPKDGGFWSWLKSDTISMSEFSSQLYYLGSGMKNYSNAVTGIDIGAVNGSVTAAHSIVKLIKNLDGLDSAGVGQFKTALASLGSTSIDEFAKAFEGAGTKLRAAGAGVVTAIIGGITSKRATLISTTTPVITSLVDMIRSKISMFRNAGILLIAGVAAGISSQRTKVGVALVTPLSFAVSVTRGYYSDFYNAGSYLVSGLAAGISANSYKVKAKARAMAKAAADAAEDELEINSPSKVFRRIGTSIPEGFAMGIDKLRSMVVQSSTEMATTSLDTVKSAISNISSMINSDIDAQPTIRPIMDLSDVRSGADAIGSLFGSPVGTLTTAGTINTMMNRKIQNGTNDDVVDAINKLRKDVGRSSGPSYTINGLNVNGDRELDDALRVIVRHAKIERRV